MTTRVAIRGGLTATYDAVVVDELLDAHEEAKSNFYLGGLRLSAVEGGRFSEAAFRMLQQRAYGQFDPIGQQLDTERIITRLGNVAPTAQPPSIRLHIPRALRVVYDIRNTRDAAHLADGIDPNVQDASLVVSVIDWVLAEFVRLHHNVAADAAQRMVQDLSTRKAPVIQDFDGFLRVLRTDLSASAHVMVLLYQRGTEGASYEELETWARPPMRHNLKRTLIRLADTNAWVHNAGNIYQLTYTGTQEVEAKGWVNPA